MNVNGEFLGVIQTVRGRTASAVVESESVDVNGAPVSVFFDGPTAIVNGEVVGVSSDRTDALVNEHPDCNCRGMCCRNREGSWNLLRYA